jgi:GT2 family glycosyltransferase
VQSPFSILVVSWNSAGELSDLLASIDEHLEAEYEVILVDNHSSDDSVAVFEATAGPNRQLVQLERNRGFGIANNIGVRTAKHELVVMLNPDCLLLDNSLVELVALAAETGALCGPRLLNEDLSPQASAFPPIASWQNGVAALWPGPFMPRAVRRRCDPWRVDEQLEVGWITAACMAAQRDPLVSLGPFDERLPQYGEDTDLCVRAAKQGVARIFAPDVARVVHRGSRSAVQGFSSDARSRRQVEARHWIAREHFGRLRAAYDAAVHLTLHLTRFAVKLVARRDNTQDRLYIKAAVASILRSSNSETERGLPTLHSS